METTNELLGDKIKRIRMEKGLTQSQLGEGLVTPSMVSQIENNKANPSYKVLEAFAERLKTPLDYFLVNVENQQYDASRHKIAKGYVGAEKYEQAAKILEQLHTQATRSHQLNHVEVCLDLAVCYLNMSRLEDAFHILEECLQRSKQEDNADGIVMTLYHIGRVELAKRKYYSAIFYMRSAFTQYESLQLKHPLFKVSLALDLGNLYQKVGDTSEALQTFDSVSRIINESDNPNLLALTYLGLSESYLALDEYQQATDYAVIASALFEAQKNVKQTINIRKRMILLTADETNYHEAVQILSQYVTRLFTHNLPLDAAVLMGEIAALYLQFEQYDKCLKTCTQALKEVPDESAESAPILRTKGISLAKQGQSKLAIQQLEKAIKVFQEHDLLSEVAETLGELASIHGQLGDFETSNRCLQAMKSTLVETLRIRGVVL